MYTHKCYVSCSTQYAPKYHRLLQPQKPHGFSALYSCDHLWHVGRETPKAVRPRTPKFLLMSTVLEHSRSRWAYRVTHVQTSHPWPSPPQCPPCAPMVYLPLHLSNIRKNLNDKVQDQLCREVIAIFVARIEDRQIQNHEIGMFLFGDNLPLFQYFFIVATQPKEIIVIGNYSIENSINKAIL